jgi:hypothetical protein
LPVSIALLVLSLVVGVAAAAWNFGALSGSWGETQNFEPGFGPVALLGVIALAAILFYVANTWGAFLLFGVFALFAVLMTAALIDSYWFFAHSWMFHGLFFGNIVAYEIFASSVALLLPVPTTYAFWTRWRFKYNLHPSPISRTVHVVSIDDELFLLIPFLHPNSPAQHTSRVK